MPNWEYCAIGPIKLQNDKWCGDYPYFIRFFLNGKEETRISETWDHLEPDEIAVLIAKLGTHGWEMVGTGNVGTPKQQMHYLYFKRAVD